ncbi:MAG: thiamine pyrophosphate-dependent dehydrogenase E1 component subunit alpha [Acidobacteriota bacterium]
MTEPTTGTAIRTETGLDADGQRELLRWMLRTRRLEERLVNLYRQGKVVGGLYRSLGQEATSVGSAYALEKGDYLGPLIRNLGAMLVRGVRPAEMFMQYMARADGPSGGKDLNNHFGDVAGRGLVAPISVLGSLVSVMNGMALGSKLKGERSVALTYIGDGGMSTGECMEALNFAAVQRTPFILIGENNGYAYSTPTRDQMTHESMTRRAEGLGARSETVDGNDVLAVHEATRRAVERCRAGDGPAFIEAITFRMKGHAEHDDQRYVPEELLEEWAAKDPIERYRAALEERGILDAEAEAAMDREVQEEILRGLEEAEKSPLPPAERALEGVYADLPRVPDGKPRIL